jgi:tRNA 2-thiouridine synthesizing protein A
MTTRITLDLKGLKCPLPALKTRKALKSAQPGTELEVLCTDPMSAIDIPALVNETGDMLLHQERSETLIRFHIRRKP